MRGMLNLYNIIKKYGRTLYNIIGMDKVLAHYTCIIFENSDLHFNFQ